MWHKRPPDAGVEQDEFRILCIKLILRQDLRMRAQIIARIGPLYDIDVLLVGNELLRVRVAIEDENKVGFGVQCMR